MFNLFGFIDELGFFVYKDFYLIVLIIIVNYYYYFIILKFKFVVT